MKNLRFLLLAGLALGVSSQVYATCTGSGDPCNAPRNGTITGHSATTLTESVQNSATPNTTGSVYFFEATTLGSAQDNATADANTAIVLTEDFTNPATANDIIVDTVKPLLASTSYHGYSKACPPGSGSPTAGGCSAWVAIGSQATDALTNAGFSNIASADTAPSQFTARTNGSVVDQTDVAAWVISELDSTEVGNCTFTNVLQPFPASGTASLAVTSADCNTLFPNRPYTLTEHLEYTPTQAAPNYTSTIFYTQAQTPVAISPATSVTHCSATLSFQNAAASPANPSDTHYTVNVGGPVSSGSATQNPAIGGTGIFSDQGSVTYTNLDPGTSYSPTITALNRGGGSWRNSAAIPYTGFTTAGFSGTFSIANITVNSADFVFSGLDLTGVTAYQMIVNGAAFGAQVNSAPVSPIHLSGLASNTQFAVQIKLIEASCSSVVPITPATAGTQFYTLPVAPTAGSFGALTPSTVVVNWTDGSTNPDGATTYHLQYSSNGGGSWTDVGTNPTKSGSAETFTITGLTPQTTYNVRVKTVSASGTPANDSAYFQIPGTATTPPDIKTITIAPLTATIVTGSSQTFTATVTDPSGNVIAGQKVNWATSGSGAGTLSAANAASTTFTATAPGTVFLQASLAGYSNVSSTITVIAAGPQFVQMPTFVMNAALTGGVVSDSGKDNVLHQVTHNWSAGTGVTFNPVTGVSADNVVMNSNVTFTSAGTFTLTDNLDNLNITASTAIVVPQVLTSLKVCPAGMSACPGSITLKTLQNQQFSVTGADQFGNAMNGTAIGSVVWTASGGSINGSGASASFSDSTIGQNIRVTATDPKSGKSGSITVDLVSFDVSSAYAYPVPYKASMGNGGVIHFVGLGSQASIRIYTTSGHKVLDIQVAQPTFDWNIKNSSGESLASGVYFYVIESSENKKNGKLIIIQ